MKDSKRYLFLFDFDGTLADTFTASPNNIGVNEAHRFALETLFGKEGVKVYDRQGGHKNRAPSELIADLLREKPELLDNARQFFEKQNGERKEGGMLWDNADPQRTITELFVQVKLEQLSGEIGAKFPDGRVWPPPCDGVSALLKEIGELNERGDVAIDIGVLSSGHTEFIKKAFSAWGLPAPRVLVTDDDIRERTYPKELFRRVKPGVFPFALAHWKWLREQGMRTDNFDLKGAMEMRERVMYGGDDPVKDGELAKSASVPFFLFDRNGTHRESFHDPNGATVESWDELRRMLARPDVLDGMREGRPLQKVFAPIFTELQTAREGREGNREGKLR
ncbi:MAG: hypothetical protein ABSE18_03400 [Minisyncoccia bacterium]|jgi:phosphoglycolate phosphatase-like HAD superfamily hydrolase